MFVIYILNIIYFEELLMKKFKDFICVVFAVLLVGSLTGCAGSNSASGGVDFKGKKIGYVPPS
jgi:hypothetical protein